MSWATAFVYVSGIVMAGLCLMSWIGRNKPEARYCNRCRKELLKQDQEETFMHG